MAVRVVLSCLILMSVLPESASGALSAWIEGSGRWFFLVVFGCEVLLRGAVLERRRRQRRLRPSSLIFLILDLIAVVSFLPLPLEANALRLLRLGRLVVLVGYWHGLGQELWGLLSRPERRYQVLTVLFLGFVLALTSAILLQELGTEHDFNADGTIDHRDGDFFEVVWWGLRQVQDSGNLVPEVHSGALLIVSVALTLSGLLLFSFLIGIGTTVVGELVELARSRRVGMRDHTVILGLTPYSSILLRGLAEMYRKNLRSYSGAVLAAPQTTEVTELPEVRGFRFRMGQPSLTRDLDRVDIQSSKRVIILGDDSADPDAGVISAILASRERNPEVELYPDLEHERNFPAARAAGGEGTHLVGSGPFLGYYLAQNVAYPGVHWLYRQLLRSSGIEIYTYLLSTEEREQLRQRGGETWLTPRQLQRRVSRGGGELLGLFTAADPEAKLVVEELELLLNPVRWAQLQRPHLALDAEGHLKASTIRGLIAIAPSFSTVTRLTRRLIQRDPTRAEAETQTPTTKAARKGLGSLRLDADRGPVERVLILGAGPRAPRLIRELVGFFGRLQVTVLAREGEPWQLVAHDAQTMLSDVFGQDPSLESGDEVVRLGLQTEREDGTAIDLDLTFILADWTHRHILEGQGAVTLAEADVIVLLLGGDRQRDSDGSIALDALHLANLERTGAIQFKPGAHILALVRDPDKGRLLEQRLASRGGPGTTRYTVIARETARHRFIMQSVFVHGLNNIYLDLLSSRGQYLSRLIPRDPGGAPLAGEFVPRELRRSLLRDHGLILLGFELAPSEDSATEDTASEASAAVDIRVGSEHVRSRQPRTWASLSALYVFGDGADLQAVASDLASPQPES